MGSVLVGALQHSCPLEPRQTFFFCVVRTTYKNITLKIEIIVGVEIWKKRSQRLEVLHLSLVNLIHLVNNLIKKENP